MPSVARFPGHIKSSAPIRETVKRMQKLAEIKKQLEDRLKELGSKVEEIEEDEMPLWFYEIVHPESRLSEKDTEVIKKWTDSYLSN